MKRDVFSGKIWNSRVRTEDTSKTEKIFGYFLGPCLMYTAYSGVAGAYLIQFYTDVLGLAGGLLMWMPLASKLLGAVVSFYIGRLIDRTRSVQGKARPWILPSGVALAVCGILLYAVPSGSYEAKIVWVVVSYNLFFSFAFSAYSLSHSLMVPLSTRNTKQRDALAMLTSTGASMIPGMLVTVVMPLLVRRLGVGSEARGTWLTVMGLLSAVAVPAALLEYYFTRERVTSTALDQGAVPFGRQIAACVRDKYWVMVIAFTLLIGLCGAISNQSLLYYCNWSLGNSVDGGAAKQILVNVIGQAPMGLGVLALWPLVRKFGKRRVTVAGFLLAAVGSLVVTVASDTMPVVLAGMFLRSIGSLPTYLTMALLSEALDHIENRHGFRVDGFSASVNGILQPVALGLSQTLLLWGMNAFGYVTPVSTAQIVAQPESVRAFFTFCFAGMPVVLYGICAMLMLFFKAGSSYGESRTGSAV